MNRIYYDTEFLEGTQEKRIFGIKTGFKTKPTIDLIAIGMVRQDGEEYYAISKDFNLNEAWSRYDTISGIPGTPSHMKKYWIRENVLKPIWRDLLIRSDEGWYAYASAAEYTEFLKEVNSGEYDYKFNYKSLKKLLKKYGKSRDQIAQEVFTFCTGEVLSLDKVKYYNVNPQTCELYGYYSAYDHVALCWLFGKMIDLPKGMPMYTKDLKQIFDEKQRRTIGFSNKPASEMMEYFEAFGSVINDKTETDLKKFSGYPKQENEHNAIADARWNKKLHEFLENI